MVQYPSMQLLLVIVMLRRWKELEESRVVCTCNLRNRNRCSFCSLLSDGEAVRGYWS